MLFSLKPVPKYAVRLVEAGAGQRMEGELSQVMIQGILFGNTLGISKGPRTSADGSPTMGFKY